MSATGLIASLSGSETETIIVKVAHLLSTYGAFPAIMAGLILAGILASTMSTSDSQLLAASSSVSQNILQEAFHLNLSKRASGGAFVFIWKYLIAPMGGVFAIYELLPAFIVGIVVIIVVSLLTKAPSQEILDEFEQAKASHDLD